MHVGKQLRNPWHKGGRVWLAALRLPGAAAEPNKGHFGPGELPVFDAKFFQMPHGRSEGWLLLEFREQLKETQGDNGSSRDTMWSDFRKRVEESLDKRSVSVDMGMDRGI